MGGTSGRALVVLTAIAVELFIGARKGRAQARHEVPLGSSIRVTTASGGTLLGRLDAVDSAFVIVGGVKVGRLDVAKVERRADRVSTWTRRGALTGALLGGAAGAIVASESCKRCDPIAFYAAYGAVLAGGYFAYAGSIIGSFDRPWADVPSPIEARSGDPRAPFENVIDLSVGVTSRRRGPAVQGTFYLKSDATVRSGIELGYANVPLRELGRHFASDGTLSTIDSIERTILYGGIVAERRLLPGRFFPRLVTGVGLYRQADRRTRTTSSKLPENTSVTYLPAASLGVAWDVRPLPATMARLEARQHFTWDSKAVQTLSFALRRELSARIR